MSLLFQQLNDYSKYEVNWPKSTGCSIKVLNDEVKLLAVPDFYFSLNSIQ